MGKFIWDEETEEYKGGDDLYFIRQGSLGPIKIGRAACVKARLRNLQCANPEPLKLLAVIEKGGWQENFWHAVFGMWRIKGEWFLPRGGLVKAIKALRQGEREWVYEVDADPFWQPGEYAEHLLDALDHFNELSFCQDEVRGGSIGQALDCLGDHDDTGMSLNSQVMAMHREMSARLNTGAA